jgi:hypothetical protein
VDLKEIVFFVFVLVLASSLVAYAQRRMGSGVYGPDKGTGQGSMDKYGIR